MKYTKEFPIFKTKVAGVKKKFDLSDPIGRKEYFEKKAGKEIAALKKYLKKGGTFIAYFMGKKNAGKGTYTKLIGEIFGKEHIGHISVGDIVRGAHKAMEDKKERGVLMEHLRKNYRGYISFDESLDALLGRSASALLPTEFILALVKRQIDMMPRKALFVDGFPRDLDQISYSLFFRDLVNYRNDPDLFIAIDIPNAVIDERIKYRVVCPECQTPRNLKLLATKDVGYDKEGKTFYLKCDDPNCKKSGNRMQGKEGDNLGIGPIKERIKRDGELIDKMFTLHGVPKILLRNAVPAKLAKNYVDAYEITPEYVYSYDAKTDTVKTLEKPWTVKDDEGVEVVSLLAPAVAIALLKQLPQALNLKV